MMNCFFDGVFRQVILLQILAIFSESFGASVLQNVIQVTTMIRY